MSGVSRFFIGNRRPVVLNKNMNQLYHGVVSVPCICPSDNSGVSSTAHPSRISSRAYMSMSPERDTEPDHPVLIVERVGRQHPVEILDLGKTLPGTVSRRASWHLVRLLTDRLFSDDVCTLQRKQRSKNVKPGVNVNAIITLLHELVEALVVSESTILHVCSPPTHCSKPQYQARQVPGTRKSEGGVANKSKTGRTALPGSGEDTDNRNNYSAHRERELSIRNREALRNIFLDQTQKDVVQVFWELDCIFNFAPGVALHLFSTNRLTNNLATECVYIGSTSPLKRTSLAPTQSSGFSATSSQSSSTPRGLSTLSDIQTDVTYNTHAPRQVRPHQVQGSDTVETPLQLGQRGVNIYILQIRDRVPVLSHRFGHTVALRLLPPTTTSSSEGYTPPHASATSRRPRQPQPIQNPARKRRLGFSRSHPVRRASKPSLEGERYHKTNQEIPNAGASSSRSTRTPKQRLFHDSSNRNRKQKPRVLPFTHAELEENHDHPRDNEGDVEMDDQEAKKTTCGWKAQGGGKGERQSKMSTFFLPDINVVVCGDCSSNRNIDTPGGCLEQAPQLEQSTTQTLTHSTLRPIADDLLKLHPSLWDSR